MVNTIRNLVNGSMNMWCDRPGSHFAETMDIEQLDELMTEIVSTMPVILVQ